MAPAPAAVRLCAETGDRAARAAGPAVHGAVDTPVDRARRTTAARRPADPLVRVDGSAAGRAGLRTDAVLASGQPQGGDIRRDVLREGLVGARQAGVRGQLAQGRRQTDPGRPLDGPGADRPRLCGAPAGGQVDHRARRADVRLRPVRLALHGGRSRHALRTDAVPYRPPAVPFDVPGLSGGRAARRRRTALRDEPHRPARPGADVLRPGRVRLSAARQGLGAKAVRRRAAGGRRGVLRPDAAIAGGCGWAGGRGVSPPV